jgi:glycosyltransferase involved in cell wall biosynthesis
MKTHIKPRASAPQNSSAACPQITLVTAVYNGEKFLEATIRSVLSQGYPNLEYIVVNDGSTDRTAEIIRKYESNLACSIYQPNQGLYAALNAGFARSNGEVMGWINASDMLHTHALFVVGSVFASFQEVAWITGLPTGFSEENGMAVRVGKTPHWSRLRFLAGANRYIQQESTFWRRGLWDRAGGALSTDYRAEGDFELWVRFFRHARLYPINALIGGWRSSFDSLSTKNRDRYNQICDQIADGELSSQAGAYSAKLIRKVSRLVQPIPKVRGLWWRLALRGLYTFPGPDVPPVIEYRDGTWRMGR